MPTGHRAPVWYRQCCLTWYPGAVFLRSLGRGSAPLPTASAIITPSSRRAVSIDSSDRIERVNSSAQIAPVHEAGRAFLEKTNRYLIQCRDIVRANNRRLCSRGRMKHISKCSISITPSTDPFCTYPKPFLARHNQFNLIHVRNVELVDPAIIDMRSTAKSSSEDRPQSSQLLRPTLS